MADKDEVKKDEPKSVEEPGEELLADEEEEGGEEEGQGTDDDVEDEEGTGDEPDVKQTLTALQKRLQEQDVTIAGLKGALEERRDVPKKPSEDDDDEEVEEPDEAFENKLRAAPARTLREMARKTEERVIKKLMKNLQKQTAQTSQFERAMAADRAKALTDFPELNTDPDFNKAAIAEYERRVQARGHVVPGDLTDAAAYAFAHRARKEVKPTVRERVRNIQDPVVRGKHAEGPGPDGADPLADLPRDIQAVAKRACKDLGISAKTWRKNWNELKGEDAAYGS